MNGMPGGEAGPGGALTARRPGRVMAATRRTGRAERSGVQPLGQLDRRAARIGDEGDAEADRRVVAEAPASHPGAPARAAMEAMNVFVGDGRYRAGRSLPRERGCRMAPFGGPVNPAKIVYRPDSSRCPFPRQTETWGSPGSPKTLCRHAGSRPRNRGVVIWNSRPVALRRRINVDEV